MIRTAVLCDVCERPLPIEEIEDDGSVIKYTKIHTTKEWDTRVLFPHLCENCAQKIDAALLHLKNRATMQQIIMERNTKLNAERRERLKTNG